MYKVYWTENGHMCGIEYGSSEMSTALGKTQELYQRQHAGENLHFITMVSENPDSVGRPGYDVTGPDYDWKKRRI